MEPDFPAAHSMDTTWFAVDGEGHVGVFFSAEDGPVPTGPVQNADLFDVLRQFGEWPAQEEGEEWWPEQEDHEMAQEQAADFGFFVYEYIGDFTSLVLPYTMTVEPCDPIHVDQLPPGVRKLFMQVRLEEAQFPSGETLQPVEYVKCFFYNEEDVGYLADDERTVRPNPGQEAKFAAFCEEFRRLYPERADGLHFQGISE
jgi:hypothetical protein